LGALVVWNAGNYAFYLIAGRTLGPDDYGLVAALLAVMVALFVLAGALQYSVARLAAATPDADRRGALFIRARRGLAIASPLVLAAAFLLAGAAWMVDHDIPASALALTAASAAPVGLLFLALGQLQGEERFGAFSTAVCLLGAPRPLALLGLALVLPGVYSALGATLLANALAAGAALWFASRGLSKSSAAAAVHASDWATYRGALAPLAAGLGGVGVLANLDVVAAKLALDDVAAGQFAAVAVLARAVILVPQALSIIVLPRVSMHHAGGRGTSHLLALAVGITVAAGAAASVISALWGADIVRLTFGESYEAAGSLLAEFVAASIPLGILVVLLNHRVGQGRKAFSLVVGLVACLHIGLLATLHGSAAWIILVDAIAAVLGIVLHEAVYWRSGETVVHGAIGLWGRAARAGRDRQSPVDERG
jgi:O-antigen/teichoic acid export membrane protein